MSEFDDQIRELLDRKANTVPPHRAVPSDLTQRARRRFAANLAGAVVVVAVLAVGAYAGVRALPGSLGTTPGHQPTGIGPTANPSQTGPPGPPGSPTAVCAAQGLQGSSQLEGAAGSRIGSLILTNTLEMACTLEGAPVVSILESTGNPLDVPQTNVQAWWEVNGTSAPPGWPVVRVEPGRTAVVRVSWTNWCGSQQPVLWQIELPGQLGVVVFDLGTDPPPCNGPSQPSTLEIGPIEPPIIP